MSFENMLVDQGVGGMKGFWDSTIAGDDNI